MDGNSPSAPSIDNYPSNPYIDNSQNLPTSDNYPSIDQQYNQDYNPNAEISMPPPPAQNLATAEDLPPSYDEVVKQGSYNYS